MLVFFWLLLLGLLGIVSYQDFRERAISWWLIPLLLITCFGIQQYTLGYNLWFGVFVNSFFLLAQLLGLSLYFSIKHRKFVNITKEYLGIGDILFFIPLCFLFSPLHFIVFFISSFIFILLGYFLWRVFQPIETIPLAGALAFCVPIYCLLFDQYNDWTILSYLYGTTTF